MPDLEDVVRSIEAAAYRSWPARELVVYDGWELRYADGFSRRGNSVYPAEPSTLDMVEKLAWCQDWYATRGLDLVVRQTPATESGLDGTLDSLGFSLEGRTDVMVADLQVADREVVARGVAGRSVEVSAKATPEWWAATAALWEIGLDRAVAWRAIIERIELPTAFALLAGRNDAGAVGLGVVDGPWLGLFEIVVAAGSRRGGLGGRVTRSLLEWGRACGATRSYLQAVADNTPAIALYSSLGFERQYSYWYRRASRNPHHQPI